MRGENVPLRKRFVSHVYSCVASKLSGLTILSRHSVEMYRGKTGAHTQLVRETLVHSCLRSLSHCGLILAYGVELVRSS